ncbi:MAG: MMPL family transporter [Firmicutes bacterium]|nr:MMPL family transporter [Bacillota bacterium]
MNKYTNIIFKFKKPLFIFLILTIGFSIAGVFMVKLNTDFSLFSTNDSIYETRILQQEEVFGSLNQIVVVVEHENFDSITIADLHDIQTALGAIPNVTTVQGVAPDQIMSSGSLTDIETLDPTYVKNYYLGFGEFSPLVVDTDTYYSIFNVFITEDFSKTNIHEIEDTLSAYDYQSYISGDTYNQTKITDYIIRILLVLPPLALLVILLVFRWQIGAFKPTMLSVLPAGIGSLWTLGIIGWLGNEVSILTAVVPIFIIVIGSADGLHFMSHYQDSKKEGKNTKTALNNTLKIVGIPMIVTTLTSMAGFLSLLSMSTDSVKDLAVYSALGILLAGIATWYVLPLILSNNINVLPKKVHVKKVDLSKGLKKLWGIPSLLIVILIAFNFFIFSGQINNEFNMLMIYKDSTIVAQNAEKIQEVNGGSIPIYVYVELEGSPLTVDSMNEINLLADQLNSLDEVNKVVNPYALMNIFYQMTFVGEIPSDPIMNVVYTAIAADEQSVIHNLISTDHQVVRLLVFPSDMENSTLFTIENTVELNNTNASVTGVQYLMRDLNVNITTMQINSILLALGVVLLMMVATLRNIKIAVASLIPIVVTVGALYAFLGITGISLNITTVIIFSITIGVGIDYAVHFSSVYKYYVKEGNSRHEAVDKAYQNSSRPIIANALGISLGLTVLMFSPLNIHFNVSILMWVSMVVSVFVTLTLLPTIFRIEKKKK